MSRKNRPGFGDSDSDIEAGVGPNAYASNQEPIYTDFSHDLEESSYALDDESPRDHPKIDSSTSKGILGFDSVQPQRAREFTRESIKDKATPVDRVDEHQSEPTKASGHTQSNSPSNNPPRVFIREQRSEFKATSFFGFLIQLYRLDVYGANKMTKRARYALERSTILFSVIALFDFVMWFILFNLIFNKGTLSFAVVSPVALMLAGCMALVSMIFETTLFTADFTLLYLSSFRKNPGQWFGLSFSIAMRVGLILFAAIVTAEPFHLLIFNGPIKELSRIEQGIEKSVAIVDELKDTQLTLASSICGDDEQAKIAKRKLQLSNEQKEKIKGQIIEKKMEKDKVLYTQRGNNPRPWKRRDGKEKNTLIGNKNWHETSCTGWLVKKNKDNPDYTRERARNTCNSLAKQDGNRISALKLELNELTEDIRRLDLQLKGVDTSGEQDIKDLAEERQACINQVNLMHEWYLTGLKGYSRKIISTSSDAEVFTLTNCYNAEESLSQCSGLEDKSTTFLNDLLIKEVANLDAQNLTDSVQKGRKKALEAVYQQRKQICSDWCFEYQEPHFFDQVRVLDQYIYGTATQWPDRNYSLTDCHYMINVLRIPPPALGRCASFSNNEDDSSILSDDQTDVVNAVTIQNVTRPNGLAYRAGAKNPDTIRCSTRLKPGYEDSTFELRWVVNGSPRNSLGLFSNTDRSMDKEARLILSDDIYEGDTIGCQIAPLGSEGEFVQKRYSDTIVITEGPTRTAVKTISSDISKRFILYWLVTAIGVFIPLISLIYKWSAPEDLKHYYSSKYQNNHMTSAEGIRAALNANVREYQDAPNGSPEPKRLEPSFPSGPLVNSTTHNPSNDTSISEVEKVPTAAQPTFQSLHSAPNADMSLSNHDNNITRK